jgi:hypothetical protein
VSNGHRTGQALLGGCLVCARRTDAALNIESLLSLAFGCVFMHRQMRRTGQGRPSIKSTL